MGIVKTQIRDYLPESPRFGVEPFFQNLIGQLRTKGAGLLIGPAPISVFDFLQPDIKEGQE
jgi:hypothetical protein